MHISTLARIVEAQGGRLIISAEFDKLGAELKQFRRKRAS